MSIEVVLFILVGGLAVAAATMMLLSENAVHSALFLIVNFICVAFLYLTLDAPFLAMVQIAVYAGAIMVLFLFVIMLLGTTKDVADPNRPLKWLPRAVLPLAGVLLLVSSVAFIEGAIDDQEPAVDQPMLRVLHSAPDFPNADFYANGELIAEDISFQEATDFLTLDAGEYSLSINPAGDEASLAIPLGSVVLEAGMTQTIIAYGETLLPQMAMIGDDLSTTEDRRSGRVMVFNAYTGLEAVSLIRTDSDFRVPADPERRRFVIESLPTGSASDPIELTEGTPHWAFVDPSDPENILFRLRDLEIERGNANLIVISGDRLGIDDTLRPVAFEILRPTDAAFGSPRAIGETLFITYLLPFQMLALLLLAAMVGAIILTQRAGLKPKPGRPTRRKVARPLTSVIAAQTGSDLSREPELDLPELPEGAETPEPAGD
jgi:NADH:ubiquinone oxidoreductase subunit 6 (subunit J)